MQKVRWEKQGMSQRAWRLAMDLGCDHVEWGGPQKFWNQGVPRLGSGFQRWKEWVGERGAARAFRRLCRNPEEGMVTWTSGGDEKWSMLDMH